MKTEEEKETNERLARIQEQRQQFLAWWREWAGPRHLTEWAKEIAWEAFKAGGKA